MPHHVFSESGGTLVKVCPPPQKNRTPIEDRGRGASVSRNCIDLVSSEWLNRWCNGLCATCMGVAPRVHVQSRFGRFPIPTGQSHPKQDPSSRVNCHSIRISFLIEHATSAPSSPHNGLELVEGRLCSFTMVMGAGGLFCWSVVHFGVSPRGGART